MEFCILRMYNKFNVKYYCAFSFLRLYKKYTRKKIFVLKFKLIFTLFCKNKLPKFLHKSYGVLFKLQSKTVSYAMNSARTKDVGDPDQHNVYRARILFREMIVFKIALHQGKSINVE